MWWLVWDPRVRLAEGCRLVLSLGQRRRRLLTSRWRWRSTGVKLKVRRWLLMYSRGRMLANLCYRRSTDCICWLRRWCFVIRKMHRRRLIGGESWRWLGVGRS